MAVLGVGIFLVGFALATAAALPIRMTIGLRTALFPLSAPLMSVGSSMWMEATGSAPRPGAVVCGGALGLFVAVMIKVLMSWRLRRGRRDWETKYKYIMPKRPLAEMFKRYHDID